MQTGVTTGSVLKYALLPGILPRVHKLFAGGFQHLAYFIVVVFNTLKIIPNGHPYLRSANHGRYSVIQALAAASSNITFDRKNLDKVTIFFVIIGGLVILCLQFVLCIAAIFTGKAFAYSGPGAGPQTMADFFKNDHPSTDLAYRLLDLVFGMPNIFKSEDMGTTPFHTGLHALFQFYSFGMLLVGTLVIIYLVTAIVLETAQSGVPFGERFNKAWAPVRLVLFFGLLLPAAGGLNLAQYLVLQSAKMGSNVATNAWLGFDEKISDSMYLGAAEEMIAKPSLPNLSSLISFMQVARTCAWAEGRVNRRDIKAYAIYGTGSANATPLDDGAAIFSDLSVKASGGTVFLRFGVQDEEKYPEEQGAVFPFCGELMMTVVDQAQPGTVILQQAYLDLVSCFWSGKPSGGGTIEDGMQNISCSSLGYATDRRGKYYADRYTFSTLEPFQNSFTVEDDLAKDDLIKAVRVYMTKAIDDARNTQIKDGEWMNDAALEQGWAGAGIWFNKIAEQNGSLTSSLFAKPDISKMPSVMEFVRTEKMKQDATTPLAVLFTPGISGDDSIAFEEPQQREVLLVLMQLFNYWGSENTQAFFKDSSETQEAKLTGNIIIDVMNVFMGTRGLFDMCKNTDVHPLAQLTALGKGLVEHAIRSFALAAGTGIGGGMLAILEQPQFAAVLQAASSFFMSFAGIGLILGFILYYVVPFMPFIYFFFALMTWVKGIFEAMVGMPLWALAHLHIDGEGMPGDAAASGYFHILEIFLRPICILIGFLGGIVIFASMVKVMNEIFYLVLSNLAGHYVDIGTGCFAPPGTTEVYTEDQFQGGTIDQFFYTVVYTIIVYLFAIPCFKLVDMVPDNIMRWLGAGISSFGSQDGDPAEGIMTHVSGGAAMIGGKLQAGFGGAKAEAMKMFS